MRLKVFNADSLLAGKKLVVVLDRIWDPILAENRAKWQEMATRGKHFFQILINVRICTNTSMYRRRLCCIKTGTTTVQTN